MKSFPLFLDVAGRDVAIIGGGEQAAQKARLVAKTEARMVLVAPDLIPELAERVQAGARHVSAVVDNDALAGARLAFIATGCAGADAAIAAVGQDLGTIINVVDRPDLCDVTTPAIVDRDPLVVAIGTEGAAPVLARQLKTRIEEILEPTLGAFVARAGRLRADVERAVPKDRRRAFWDWAFRAPRRLFTHGQPAEAERVLAGALAAGGPPGREGGFVSIVGAGPGAPDMLTLRAVNRLQEADLILYDRLVDPAALELARRDAERIYVGKAPGAHAWSQGEIDAKLVEAAGEGLRVVRLKGGDPGIFARAAEEAAALDAAGIAWEMVAGVTAATAAAAETGMFLTERGAIRSLTLTTGQTRDGATPDWRCHAKPGNAIAFYMGVATAGRIAADLLRQGVPGETTVEIVENASRPTMRHLSTTLNRLAETILDERVENPAVILLRWPAEIASIMTARAEDRAANPDAGGPEGNGALEIAAHPHG
ncbi:MAG: siroheme synthase CysG [Pseudomonadota bacterium]